MANSPTKKTTQVTDYPTKAATDDRFDESEKNFAGKHGAPMTASKTAPAIMTKTIL